MPDPLPDAKPNAERKKNKTITEKERKENIKNGIICIVFMLVFFLVLGFQFDWNFIMVAIYLGAMGIMALVLFAGRLILRLLGRFIGLFHRKPKCPFCKGSIQNNRCVSCSAWICNYCSTANRVTETKCSKCGSLI